MHETPEGEPVERRTIMLGVLSTTLVAGVANAQAAGGAQTVVQELVVTAQKRSEALRDVPMSVTAMTGDKLERSSVQGVSEALSTVPGVAMKPGLVWERTFQITLAPPLGTGEKYEANSHRRVR